jgi:hypothetical protein
MKEAVESSVNNTAHDANMQVRRVKRPRAKDNPEEVAQAHGLGGADACGLDDGVLAVDHVDVTDPQELLTLLAEVRDRAARNAAHNSKLRTAYSARIVTSERHLRLVLGEYTDHCNTHRPHRALQQGPPAGRPDQPAPSANVQVLRRDRLGGVIREYSQVA